MLRCAVDVRRSGIRLALYCFYDNEPPTRLEIRLITSRSTARVVETLQIWRCLYLMDGGDPLPVVVGCRSDAWPSTLARRIQEAGYTLEWIEDADAVADSVSFLQSLQQGPVFMRASVMAQWLAHGQSFNIERPAFEVQYALLRYRLMEMENELYIEGRLPCPGHLSPTCPTCEYFNEGKARDWGDESDFPYLESTDATAQP